MIPPKTFNTVAQSAHFFSGLAVVLVCARLRVSWPVTVGAWTAFTLAKEFWFDFRYETPEVRGSSLLDAVVSLLGAGAGLALLAVTA